MPVMEQLELWGRGKVRPIVGCLLSPSADNSSWFHAPWHSRRHCHIVGSCLIIVRLPSHCHLLGLSFVRVAHCVCFVHSVESSSTTLLTFSYLPSNVPGVPASSIFHVFHFLPAFSSVLRSSPPCHKSLLCSSRSLLILFALTTRFTTSRSSQSPHLSLQDGVQPQAFAGRTGLHHPQLHPRPQHHRPRLGDRRLDRPAHPQPHRLQLLLLRRRLAHRHGHRQRLPHRLRALALPQLLHAQLAPPLADPRLRHPRRAHDRHGRADARQPEQAVGRPRRHRRLLLPGRAGRGRRVLRHGLRQHRRVVPVPHQERRRDRAHGARLRRHGPAARRRRLLRGGPGRRGQDAQLRVRGRQRAQHALGPHRRQPAPQLQRARHPAQLPRPRPRPAPRHCRPQHLRPRPPRPGAVRQVQGRRRRAPARNGGPPGLPGRALLRRGSGGRRNAGDGSTEVNLRRTKRPDMWFGR